MFIAHEGSIIPYFLTGIQKISLPNSRWSHTAAAHMHESGMSELVYTVNQQQSNKEFDCQKAFYVIWKYKNIKIKCI